ncbi:VOC family protein [Ornithinibacillus sp. L9]|uniref:VOC family protein n=1 Tax=Ornithinibacillus caprae TaxID=2678566 RepID=A0A6N8FNY6_9BACI|nr:VOC family protein [Ornithinibacillus caprae]MUK89817.1 VOC family protein [Ornithinibacillus caprae]
MLNQVCVLTVKVDDLDASLEFYTKVLDFSVSKKYSDTIISLEHNGLPFILEKADTVGQPSRSNTVLLGIQSTNIHDGFERLKSKQVNVLFDEPKPCPPGYFFVIEDPTGKQIEIVEFVEE